MRYHMFMGVFVFLAASLAVIGFAEAQPDQVRDSQTMSFDLWCQENAGLPPGRCDKRAAEDESSFEAYRATVEQHETTQNSQASINRDIMNSDPIDNPQKNDLGPQQP
jgi:hypothetical protein